MNFHSWIDTTSSIKLKLVLVYYSYQLGDQNCDNHVTTQHVQDIHKSLWVVSKTWFWHFEITLILRANHEFDLKSRLTWNQPRFKKKNRFYTFLNPPWFQRQLMNLTLKSRSISKKQFFAHFEINLDFKANLSLWVSNFTPSQCLTHEFWRGCKYFHCLCEDFMHVASYMFSSDWRYNIDWHQHFIWLRSGVPWFVFLSLRVSM